MTSKTVESLTIGKDVNSSKVNIHNTINVSHKQPNTDNPTPPPASQFILPNPYEQATQNIMTSPDFLVVYSKMLAELLTINDFKLLAQLVDLTGHILFNLQDLIRLISLFIGCTEDLIQINILPPEEIGCFSHKASIFRSIENIKVQGRDFKFFFNQHYNSLRDDYRVSLDRIVSF